MRPHQWAKNVLVLLPVGLAHRLTDTEPLADAALAFAALSLLASGTYVINDLLDRESDRRHPTKRNRPFASGALSAQTGLMMAAVLIGGGAALALTTLPLLFAGVLGTYLVTTLAYSLGLKRVVLLDVIVLGGLYALRVLAGSAATGIPASEWLLAFSLFFFLSLALLKRYAELRLMENRLHVSDAHDTGRGYVPDDLALLRAIGPATGLLSILVLALYATSPAVAEMYSEPRLLWLLAPLLTYWVMRMWIIAHRRRMPDDPVFFAVTDPASYAVVAATVLVLGAASVVTL